MTTIATIEQLTKAYADSRDVLKKRVQTLEDETSALKRRHLPLIRRVLDDVQRRYDALKMALEEGRGLFGKPKTHTFHGVRVGFKKEKGRLTWESDEQVVRLIKKHFPDQAETLIRTRETPVKDALAQLPASDLKKLGVRLEDDEERPFIKTTDSEIDKMVDALLKDEEQGKEAA